MDSTEAPAPLPDALSPEDRVQFELYVEKLARIEAQMNNAQIQLERLRTEFQKVVKLRDDFSQVLAAKYQLSSSDKVVLENGFIQRKPA